MRYFKFIFAGALLCLNSSLAHAETASDEQDSFSSDDNFRFISAENVQGQFIHTKYRIGYLQRPEAKSSDLGSIEVYSVPASKEIGASYQFCKTSVERITGPLESPWVEGPHLSFQTHYGQAIELSVGDKDPDGEIKDRRFVLAYVHGKPYLFRAAFTHQPTPAEIQEYHEFIKSLRSAKEVSATAMKKSAKPNRAPASL